MENFYFTAAFAKMPEEERKSLDKFIKHKFAPKLCNYVNELYAKHGKKLQELADRTKQQKEKF